MDVPSHCHQGWCGSPHGKRTLGKPDMQGEVMDFSKARNTSLLMRSSYLRTKTGSVSALCCPLLGKSSAAWPFPGDGGVPCSQRSCPSSCHQGFPNPHCRCRAKLCPRRTGRSQVSVGSTSDQINLTPQQLLPQGSAGPAQHFTSLGFEHLST